MVDSINRSTLVLVLVLASTLLDACTAFLQGFQSQRSVGKCPWDPQQARASTGDSQGLDVPSLIPAPPSVSTTTSSVTSTDPKTGATTTVVTTVTTITAPAGSLDSNLSSLTTGVAARPPAVSPMSAMAQSIANLPDYGDENVDEATAAMKNMLAMSQMMGERSESTRSEYESEEEEVLAQGGELWFLEDGSEDSLPEQPSATTAVSDGKTKVVQYDEYGDPLDDDDDDQGPSSADATAAMEAIARAKLTGAAFEQASGVNAEDAREALRTRMRSQGLASGSTDNSGIDPKRFQDTEDDVIEMGGDPWFLSDEPVKR